ncbi:MAG: endopeptidase La [Bacilli bacterium]|jgi:ATP-dependent Lon protease|nr:endopeptidase La [Bacilli bacterium]
MEYFGQHRVMILPNSKGVGLPDIEMTITAKNTYDTHLLSQLKNGDEFVMCFANKDNVYGDFNNIVFPGVKEVGCLCRVVSITPNETGLQAHVLGKAAVDLLDFNIDVTTGTVMANMTLRPQYERDDNQVYEMMGKFASSYTAMRAKFNQLPELPDFSQTVQDIRNIPYHIAAFLSTSMFNEQILLEEKDPIEKFRVLINDLDRFNLDSKIEFDIQKKVSEAIDKNQREYVLREKMKVVKDQLKEFDGGDPTDAYEKAVSLHPEMYPDNIQLRIKNEVGRLKAMPAGSQEISVLTSYLDLLIALPWKISSADNDDLTNVKKVLDANHYGLDKQKDRIMQYLAVKQLTHSLKAPILCFYGAPGVGKTSLAISIAQALGRKFTKVALGGISDEAEIRGHRRTYVGALPGQIISGIEKCGTNNPVFLLDEIDKIDGGGYHGDPASALLEVLDPEQNAFFKDNYLDEPFDLSKVMFICTANDISKIPPALFDRLEMIELNTYTKFEKMTIAKTHLIGLEEKENGIKPGMMEWTDEALDYIIEYYTMEAGVRNLRRNIGTIDRKFAVDYLRDPEHFNHLVITKEIAQRYLGAEIFYHDKDVSNSQVGIINGLAYTDAGGEVLRIECNTFPGKGQLILTGNLGSVMKEACETALSYVKSIGPELGINPDFFSEHDIHIHFPESATPKDGPSAGVATALCIISAICNVRIRNDVAMTGEIDLRGNSLPIGGLREKTNAATREHIKTVFIPAENHKDVLELPKEITDCLAIVEVKKARDMFSGVFLDDITAMKKQIESSTSGKKASSKSKKGEAKD